MKIVVDELERAGLTVNAGKTAAWTYDPQAPLPPAVEALRTSRCTVLGSTAPWLDPEGDFSRLDVHACTEEARVVQSAKDCVAKLAELRGAGLSAKTAFLILQSFSQGQVTHLLRANHEASGWSKQFDEVMVNGVELLVGSSLDDEQRRQIFLRLADGGLGFGSCELACEAAFLASWALTLKDVAECLGVFFLGELQKQMPAGGREY